MQKESLATIGEKIYFFPFIRDIKKYKWYKFRPDIWSAFLVALLTIPQAIAYSLLAELPAKAGILSAIFGSIFTSVFGSSKHLIAGPSTAVAILIQATMADIMHTYYPNITPLQNEAVALNILTQIVLIIGILQLIAGFFNLSKILQFVSRSVILGYFSAVIFAIVVNQLFYLLGIPAIAEGNAIIFRAFDLIKSLGSISYFNAFFGVVCILIILFLKKKFSDLPYALIMILLATIFSFLLSVFPVSNFELTTFSRADISGEPFATHWPIIDIQIFDKIFFSALAIAILSILEVFTISKGVAAKSGQLIYSNQMTYAIGISNFVLSFFTTAMPASGSLSRSTLNFQSGAKSRFSGIMSGIFAAFLYYFLWPCVKYIPLSSLAALLIVMAPSLIDKDQVKFCFKATIGDAFVFILTFLCALIFSLDVAFFIGIIISIAFYLKRAAVPHLMEYTFDSSGRLKNISSKSIHKKIRIIGIGGELFFAAVDLVQNTLQRIVKDPYVKVVILRLSGVYHVDASTCLAIMRLQAYLQAKEKFLLISGVHEEVFDVFKKTGLAKKLGEDRIFLADETKPQMSTKRAYHKAQDLATTA